jgi:uronate dehydrogenase
MNSESLTAGNRGIRVLMTGAAGRVGRQLADDLRALGHEVVGCDIVKQAGIIKVDCLDTGRMAELCQDMDAVIHLAGIPNGDPGWKTVSRMNIDAHQSMLQAALVAGVRRYIFASSIHVIGAMPVDVGFSPSVPPTPSGIYGVSKIAGEALLYAYTLRQIISGISIRICTYCEEPRNARELKTWLSHVDAAHLFDRCLIAPFNGYRMIWGVSANTRLVKDDPTAVEIGYRPRSDAEVFAEKLTMNGVDVSGLGPWPTIGGRMTGADT